MPYANYTHISYFRLQYSQLPKKPIHNYWFHPSLHAETVWRVLFHVS